MRSLATVVAGLLLLAPAALAEPDARTVTVNYTAGPGDAVCPGAVSPFLQGAGCVVLFPLAGETSLRITVFDLALHGFGPVGFAVCSPNCGGAGSLGVGCGTKTVPVTGGKRVLVFLDEALGPFDCPLLGMAVAGTVTATFS
ncbi:MAG TPA: hypothetical protein VGR28_06210 [Candidatus Thermoplasmatota archaeon]|jgi:hypothetical protein|nr:hypothetical protein [Candidatus Thermoplasmatota archaeon]